MNPCVRHTCTMPRRSSAPILCFIRYKWFFTVCSERENQLAISLFVSPSAIKGINCCSRRVNPSRWWTLAEGKEVASRSKYRNSVAQSRPGQIASPPCSARTPSTTSSAEDVVEGVRALQGGEAICPGLLCATLFRYLEREATSFPSASVHQRLGLTRREQQLIPLIAEGLTNKEIANRFCLSEQTVKNHLYRMKHKIGAEDRLGIVQVCRTSGFMP